MSIPAPTTKESKTNDVNDDDENDIFIKLLKHQEKDSSKTTDKNNDQFHGTIYRKMGKNSSTTIYYMNQSTLHNHGDGLDIDERNDLNVSIQKANEIMMEKTNYVRHIQETTVQLLSEPLNKDIASLLPSEESSVITLSNDVNEAMKYKANESKCRTIKRKIETTSKVWKKRKQICIDFLNTMDECTEGTISAKKCLAGNGQIDIESDDVILKQAKESFHARRNKKMRLITGHSSGGVGSSDVGPLPSESFVGVMLGANGGVQRISIEQN